MTFDCPSCSESLPTISGMRNHHTKKHGEKLANRECKSCGTEFYDKKSRRKLCDNCLEEFRNPDPKPQYVTIPENKNWSELNAGQRHYYKNREKVKEKKYDRKRDIREWYQRIKSNKSCSLCDESRNAALDFHHKRDNEKKMLVSEMVSCAYSKEKIKAEIEKCEVLCANCHRVEHHKSKNKNTHDKKEYEPEKEYLTVYLSDQNILLKDYKNKELELGEELKIKNYQYVLSKCS